MSVVNSRVVGLGSIGRRYVDVLGELNLGGVDSLSVRRDWNTGDEQWPKLSDVDLTIVATRTSRHVSDAMQLGLWSRTLLVEKPVCARVDAHHLPAEFLGQQNVYVSAPLRFTEGFGVVQDEIVGCGMITGVASFCKSWLPDWRPGSNYRESYSASADDGGVRLDLVHEIDYCRVLFGDPSAISATLRSSSALGIAAESNAILVWHFPGFLLNMELDYTSKTPRRGLRIDGTRRSVEWDLLSASVRIWDHEARTEKLHECPNDLERNRLLARQIMSAVDPTSDARISGLLDGLAAVRICDAARASHANSGVATAISDWPPCQ